MQTNILSAKTDLEELNSRLAAYVHRVRQLKDENDMNRLTAAITVLEEDLRSLKASYECQVNHMSSSIKIITEEKYELQKEVLAHKETDAHFMDRISLESSKNAKLLLEVSQLKSELSDRERDITSLKLRIRQLQLEAGDGASIKSSLLEEIHDLKQKVKARLDWYVAQFAANDARMQEVAQKEAAVPELLLHLRKTARDEIRKHQDETNAFSRKTISVLQSQLVEERKRNRFLKMESYQTGKKNLTLQKMIVELNAKIQTQGHQIHLMEQTLHSAQRELDRTRCDYEEKLRQVESAVVEQTSINESTQNQANDVRNEVARLRALLEAEEQRLHLNLTNGLHTGDPQQLTKPSLFDHGAFELDLPSENPEKLLNEDFEEPEVKCTNYKDYLESSDSICTPTAPRVGYLTRETDKVEQEKRIRTKPLTKRKNHMTETEHIGIRRHRSKSSLDTEVLNSVNTIGSIQICEVDPDGRFARIWNSSHQSEFDLGKHQVQQKINDELVNQYQFPAGFRLSTRTLVTLWAGGDSTFGPFEFSPKDIKCQTVAHWVYGPSCTTMLCDPSGQVISWLNPPYRALSCRLPFSTDHEENVVEERALARPSGHLRRLSNHNTNEKIWPAPIASRSVCSHESSSVNTTPDLPMTASNDLSGKIEKFSNGNQPNCLCHIPTNLFHLKPRRPCAPHNLKHPEYPATLGLQPNQREKASQAFRAPPIGLLDRPQM
ncbi:hypothetical protein FGIG_10435 [Fasciola gigantica]|uniref:LTD domain-containing protein n=1 Tax=Fasciola gigantica TaxID=46835 RepID=A0A504YG05_FASGI|nr:hypothetical protein FGIG_10435 [Fasciola gigantica]